MDFTHVFNLDRWRQRFKSEASVRDEVVASGQAPDATVDEVGAAPTSHGFDGAPLHGHTSNGYGTGDTGGPGWAGWAGTSGPGS